MIKTQLNNNIEKVLSKLDIEYEAFSENIYSVCPIHQDSDNPRAFSYSREKGIWKCWTRDCQNDHGNDIFGLIRGVLSQKNKQEVEFSDVLKWSKKILEINGNVKIQNNKEEIVVEDQFVQLVSTLNKLHKTKNDTKTSSIDIDLNLQITSPYFIDRGFTLETLSHFGVKDCDQSGIMKDRAVIPIHNDEGSDIIGLIGRSTKEYKIPKFIIYPKGFDKRNYFYNYHRAIKRAKETSCLYILEGQGDVWKMHEAGVTNAVGIFGKVLTEQQIDKLLKLPITHLIILTDNDQSGKESKVQIKRQLGRLYKLSFPKMSEKDIGDMTVEKIQKTILSNMKGTY